MCTCYSKPRLPSLSAAHKSACEWRISQEKQGEELKKRDKKEAEKLFEVERKRTKKERLNFIESFRVTTSDLAYTYKCLEEGCSVRYTAIDAKHRVQYKRDG